MAIIDIKTDFSTFNTAPLVRLRCDDTLAEVGTPGYLSAEALNISTINSGAFEFAENQTVLVSASDGKGFFTLSEDFSSLEAMVFSTDVIGTPVNIGDIPQFSSTAGQLEDSMFSVSDFRLQHLADSNIWIGDGSAIAVEHPVTGDIALSNTGVTAVTANLLQRATLKVTAAQLATVFDTPIQIVAPVAGTLYRLQSFQVFYSFGSSQFASGGNLFVQYGNTAEGAGVAASAPITNVQLTGATADTYFLRAPTEQTELSSAVLGEGLFLANLTNNYSVGTGGELTVDIWYSTTVVS